MDTRWAGIPGAGHGTIAGLNRKGARDAKHRKLRGCRAHKLPTWCGDAGREEPTDPQLEPGTLPAFCRGLTIGPSNGRAVSNRCWEGKPRRTQRTSGPTSFEGALSAIRDGSINFSGGRQKARVSAPHRRFHGQWWKDLQSRSGYLQSTRNPPDCAPATPVQCLSWNHCLNDTPDSSWSSQKPSPLRWRRWTRMVGHGWRPSSTPLCSIAIRAPAPS